MVQWLLGWGLGGPGLNPHCAMPQRFARLPWTSQHTLSLIYTGLLEQYNGGKDNCISHFGSHWYERQWVNRVVGGNLEDCQSIVIRDGHRPKVEPKSRTDFGQFRLANAAHTPSISPHFQLNLAWESGPACPHHF